MEHTHPTLTPISILPSPSGLTRAWQSTPHPSKPLLATASSDKSVNVWSLRDYRLLSTIAGGHKRSVRTVGWKDYGKRSAQGVEDGQDASEKVILATGAFDANVGIWEYNIEYNQDSAEGEMEADLTTGDRNEEEEWHFSTLLTGPDSEIKSLEFSPAHYSANLLATSSRDKSVWIWEEVEDDEWETIAVLSEHTGDVKCVSWNPQREIIASGSYDDTIRLWRDVEEDGDWACVGVLEGSGGTVWDVAWERYTHQEGIWEPRLASCSDDMNIRIWKRTLSERERAKQEQVNGTSGTRLPSIIRPASAFETWEQEVVLPTVHVRPIYAISWSQKTGLLVSCGGDGVVAVYRESPEKHDTDVVMNGTQEQAQEAKRSWEIVAMIDEAHGEYEINHVCWAPRWDKSKRKDGEEVLVSTGDDGTVRIWELPEGLV